MTAEAIGPGHWVSGDKIWDRVVPNSVREYLVAHPRLSFQLANVNTFGRPAIIATGAVVHNIGRRRDSKALMYVGTGMEVFGSLTDTWDGWNARNGHKGRLRKQGQREDAAAIDEAETEPTPSWRQTVKNMLSPGMRDHTMDGVSKVVIGADLAVTGSWTDRVLAAATGVSEAQLGKEIMGDTVSGDFEPTDLGKAKMVTMFTAKLLRDVSHALDTPIAERTCRLVAQGAFGAGIAMGQIDARRRRTQSSGDT